MARRLLGAPRMKLPYLLLPFLAISACTGDSFSDQAASVEGIYRVDSHLRNEASCSPGGAPVSDSQTFAYAKRVDILGIETLQLLSCASLDDCRAKAAQASFGGPISFAFTLTAADGDALTGFEATTGFTTANGTCEMPELSNLELVMTGDALQLEKRTQVGADYPADNGACTSEKGRAAAEAAPCTELETLAATKLESL
jgi:hypothetical protein